MPTMTVKRRPVIKKSSGVSKNTAPARKKTSSPEIPLKRTVVRTRKSSPAPQVEKQVKQVETTDQPIYTEKDAKKKVGGMTFLQLSNRIGLPMDSERFAVAVEILKGGETRQEINHRVKDLLPPSPRTKSPKTVSNLVSSMVKRMEDCGFAIQGEWRMTPPQA